MELKKLYVLAKIRKLPTFQKYGEYEVVFLYSDKEKNFKRIADCTPELQKLVASKSVCLVNAFLNEHKMEATVYAFNSNTKESFQVSEAALLTEECLKEMNSLFLDYIYAEVDDDYSAWHMISNLVCEISDFGTNKDGGKVFMKCGNKAKFEVLFSEDFEVIYETIDAYLA